MGKEYEATLVSVLRLVVGPDMRGTFDSFSLASALYGGLPFLEAVRQFANDLYPDGYTRSTSCRSRESSAIETSMTFLLSSVIGEGLPFQQAL